jgi:outer membrane protein TolC
VYLRNVPLIPLFLAALGSAVGCQKYQSKPLTSDSVLQRLNLPDEKALQDQVNSIKHPLLRPTLITLSDGLTPEQASVIAVIANPSLRAERDQRQIAAAQLLQAGLLPNPQFVGGVDFPYNSAPPDNFTAYTAGLEWEVTSVITRPQKQRAAAAALDAANLDLAWKEWQVAQQAKTAAWSARALEAELESARQVHQQFAESQRLLERAVEEHNKTVIDLAAVQASAQDAQQIVLTQQRDLVHQRLTLNRTLGLAADREVKLKPVVLPTRLDPPPSPDLLAHVEDRRLDLLALKRGYESQDATLRAAILAQFPKITLGFSNARDTTNVHTFGLGVTIDIPIFDRNQAVIATESATRDKLFDEYADRLFTARSDIASAIADIRAANEQIAAAQQAIPSLQRLLDIYTEALNQGNLDALSVYTAQSTLSQKRIALIKLQQQLVENWIALEIASGQYLPLEIGTSNPTTRGTQP